jgi:hypothetical protein
MSDESEQMLLLLQELAILKQKRGDPQAAARRKEIKKQMKELAREKARSS